jgi:hypothetical protein
VALGGVTGNPGRSQGLNLKRTPRGRVWQGGKGLLLGLGRGWGGEQGLWSWLLLGKGLSRVHKRLLLLLLRKHWGKCCLLLLLLLGEGWKLVGLLLLLLLGKGRELRLLLGLGGARVVVRKLARMGATPTRHCVELAPLALLLLLLLLWLLLLRQWGHSGLVVGVGASSF